MIILPRSNEKEFTKLLANYKNKWSDYMSDKTYVTGTKHWYYTHKKVHSGDKEAHDLRHVREIRVTTLIPSF